VTVQAGIRHDGSEVANLDRSLLGAGRFRLNRASMTGSYVYSATTLEIHPDVTGLVLEPGVGMIVSYELASGDLRWQRAEATIAARKSVSDFVISTRIQGGVAAGTSIPPQVLFELGGENALPGYDYKQFAGDRAAAAGVLASYTLPLFRRPWRLIRSLMIPGLSPGFAAGIQSGWVEASSASVRSAIARLDATAPADCQALNSCPLPLSTPTNGVRATVDVRMTFFGGLVGLGVARAVDRAAPWRIAFRFGQEF
jgi:hypothetical protein